MAQRPTTILSQLATDDDVDLQLLNQAQEAMSEGKVGRLEKIFGAKLRLSKADRKPAGEEGLRPFDDGPSDEERIDLGDK